MLLERVVYAGDTPLLSELRVSQVGPLRLRIAAGRFRTTGEARVEIERPEHDALVKAGKAERLGDGRVRAWLLDERGEPIEPAREYAVPDTDLDIPQAAEDRAYGVWLCTDGVQVRPMLRRVQGVTAPLPAPWRECCSFPIVLTFVVPVGTTDLRDIPIEVLTVKPGFPAGTGPADWRLQSGRARV
jgi:hypothetical protein